MPSPATLTWFGAWVCVLLGHVRSPTPPSPKAGLVGDPGSPPMQIPNWRPVWPVPTSSPATSQLPVFPSASRAVSVQPGCTRGLTEAPVPAPAGTGASVSPRVQPGWTETAREAEGKTGSWLVAGEEVGTGHTGRQFGICMGGDPGSPTSPAFGLGGVGDRT